MIFAALMIQGITPGPFLVAEHPDVFWGVIASMYIGNVMLLVLNLPMVGLWVQMLRVPYGILAPVIVLFTTIGVYSTQNQVFDIYSMLFFAVLGYGMRKLHFDPAPLPLAFVLGPMVERSLRQSLLISGGDATRLPNDSSDCMTVMSTATCFGRFGKLKDFSSGSSPR